MTPDIQKEIKDATEIYECWNWEMLSEELESGYDRGALMDLVGKYKVLLKIADSQQELIEQKDTEIEKLREIQRAVVVLTPMQRMSKAMEIIAKQKGSST